MEDDPRFRNCPRCGKAVVWRRQGRGVYWYADCSRCEVTFGPYMLDEQRARVRDRGFGAEPVSVVEHAASSPRYPRRQRRWSEREDAQLASEFDEGLSTDVIATLHARSAWAIAWRLFKLGKIGMPEN